MNIYRYAFQANCPADGETIDYQLEIRHDDMIMAEDIVEVCRALTDDYQEIMADVIAGALPGSIKITATHSGVEVETIREGHA